MAEFGYGHRIVQITEFGCVGGGTPRCYWFKYNDKITDPSVKDLGIFISAFGRCRHFYYKDKIFHVYSHWFYKFFGIEETEFSEVYKSILSGIDMTDPTPHVDV